MKKLQAVLLGAGDRGITYSDYALTNPEELEIIAVIEPNDLRRKLAMEKYHVPTENAFTSLDEFLEKNIRCDFVINATMDLLHYPTAVKLIEAKYDMLLEKPIVTKREELLDLYKRAKENDVKVLVCHGLRYSAFYRKIKEIVNSGVIGDIVAIEAHEHVGMAHFLACFVRGKWYSEEACGSGFLLAKSCHDLDMICWMNDVTRPQKIVSFASRSQFIPEKMPEGATEFCHECPHADTCFYNAQKIYLDKFFMPFTPWHLIDKPVEEITLEEKEELLRTTEYGKCAYRGGDLVDRQVVTIQFENGSVATFTLVGAVSACGRNIHISGTAGEIEGDFEDDVFTVRIFDRSKGRFDTNNETIDVKKHIEENGGKFGYVSHHGADYNMMRDAVAYFRDGTKSVSLTSLQGSIDGHKVAFDAEESRRMGKIIEF